jgi:hypothetical protein
MQRNELAAVMAGPVQGLCILRIAVAEYSETREDSSLNDTFCPFVVYAPDNLHMGVRPRSF